MFLPFSEHFLPGLGGAQSPSLGLALCCINTNGFLDKIIFFQHLKEYRCCHVLLLVHLREMFSFLHSQCIKQFGYIRIQHSRVRILIENFNQEKYSITYSPLFHSLDNFKQGFTYSQDNHIKSIWSVQVSTVWSFSILKSSLISRWISFRQGPEKTQSQSKSCKSSHWSGQRPVTCGNMKLSITIWCCTEHSKKIQSLS